MPKTFNSVWIHLVFTTKDSELVLTRKMRDHVCDFLRNESVLKGYHLDSINGYQNHLHILYKQKLSESISKSAQWFKGRSSKWINDNFELETIFRWQQGYGAFSVSRQNLIQIRNYIYNQERIHKTRTITEELKMLKKYGNAEM